MTLDFISPRFIDFILCAVAVEAALLYIVFPGLRRASDLWLTLASGAALMTALRFALAGGEMPLVAAPLTAALFFHTLYLRARVGRRDK